jgi:hypothetical protein
MTRPVVPAPAHRSTPGGDDGGRVIFPGAASLRALIPGAFHEASLEAAARPRPRNLEPWRGPRGQICAACGTQSTVHVRGGRCDDVDACARRAYKV